MNVAAGPQGLHCYATAMYLQLLSRVVLQLELSAIHTYQLTKNG